ncbi:MAG: hypothetical protein H0T69_10910 [Thermoleophilaceae bacterium]|nr:hypothetical protein [Thermoleophilaceae bacterium]
MRHSLRRRRAESPPAAPTRDGRLSGVRALSLDDHERPNREDLNYGHTIFTRGVVPLPRFLTGRKTPPRG